MDCITGSFTLASRGAGGLVAQKEGRVMKRLVTLSVLSLGLLFAPDLPADEPVQSVRGRIVDVQPAAHEITVQPHKGAPMKFTLDDQSQVQLGRGISKLDQLRPGMRVRVAYDTKNGANHVVRLHDSLATLDRIQSTVNNALDTARAYTYSQREEFQRRLQTTMRDLDERIEELQEQAAESGAETRRRLDKELDQLRQQREVLRQRANQVQNATVDNWRDIQAGVNSIIGDVERTIDRVRGNINNAPTTPPPPPPK
jgi:hypothetical protein